MLMKFINQSKKIKKLFCLPGNGGTASIAQNININLSNLTKTAIPTYPVPRSVTLSKPTGSETTPLYAWIAISIPADQKLPSAYLYQNFPLLIQVGQVEYQNVTYALYRSYSPTAANSLKVLSHD